MTRRFKLTVYYEGEDDAPGERAVSDFHEIRGPRRYPPEVKVEAMWEEISSGQQPER